MLGNVSLRFKMLAVLIFLGAIPLASAMVTLGIVRKQEAAHADSAAALKGALHLERINGLVYAAVMESRGIYMSSSWNEASKFGGLLEKDLAAIAKLADQLKQILTVSDPAQVDALGRGLAEFIKYRTELLRLAKEDSTAAARAYGDNDANRSNRTALNKALQQVAASSEAHVSKSGEVADTMSDRVRYTILGCAGLSALALIVGVIIVQTGFARPIEMLKRSMTELAGGARDVVIHGVARGDEIGEMARTLRVFEENLEETDRMREEQEQGKKRAQEQRKAELEALAVSFEQAVGSVVDAVAAAASELSATAEHLNNSSKMASEQSAMVSVSSENASTSVRSVASAAEELSHSIQEIGQQMGRSTQMAAQATAEAQQTNAQVRELSEGAQKIGGVIELINSIASQTNLLALNATIEAARAGETGKGFAVVAHEVKTLAEQTAKATAEIASQVAGIQSSTEQVTARIGGIAQNIRELDAVASSIAAAVEEQGAATQDIARNVLHASDGVSEVAGSIQDVRRAAQDSNSSASQVLSSAHRLSQQSQRLRGEVEKFLVRVRAA